MVGVGVGGRSAFFFFLPRCPSDSDDGVQGGTNVRLGGMSLMTE